MSAKLRIGTFNVQNLFSRPKALHFPTWAEGRPVLEDYGRLQALLAKPRYSSRDRSRIAAILRRRADQFWLLEAAGDLARGRGAALEVVAKGRGDWDGWVELRREPLGKEKLDDTARTIARLDADILVVVEVEDRRTLQRFNDHHLARHRTRYPHVMLIDGNDPRGLDLGVLSRRPIASMRSHVDDGGRRPIFSRDCLELVFELGAHRLHVLANHFKSKGYGPKHRSDARRRRQARRVAELYVAARRQTPWCVVAGDLNDTPTSPSLRPLLSIDGLEDPNAAPTFRPSREKLDYLILSPALFRRVEGTGLVESLASDHSALWVEIGL